jgi:adenine-specific DNA-methyltransferase
VLLIKNLIKTICYNEDIVLDFFSGSATTAHAVMQLNAEDGGNRKFIMVQLPEIIKIKSANTNKAKKIINAALSFLDKHNMKHNICEIGKERIRRAGKKIKEETGKQYEDLKERIGDVKALA